MIAETHFNSGWFFGQIEKQERENEADKIRDKMDGIRYDGDRVGE